jgi:phosphopantothenoylcysteine decarboxylase
MPRVLLGVTGSVAAVRTPAIARALLDRGDEVRVVATDAALSFFNSSEVEAQVWRDSDEWPSEGYRRDDPVLHIEFRKWADLLIIAPLDANTLAKIALGLSDNFLTCIVRAWDYSRPIVLAPAMNTMMWDSPVTVRHFRQMLADRGDLAQPSHWRLDDVVSVFKYHAPGIVIVPPIEKELACGDNGIGGIAETEDILRAVGRVLKTHARTL